MNHGQLEEEVGDYAVEDGQDVAGYGAEAAAARNSDVFGDGADEEGEVGGYAWGEWLGWWWEREERSVRTRDATEWQSTDADARDSCRQGRNASKLAFLDLKSVS